MRLSLGTLPAVLRLAWQGVRRRPLPSALTALSVALAVALATAVETLRISVVDAYDARRVEGTYHLILGPAGGSPLQTVLSTLYHVDVPYGTVPWSVYEEVRSDGRVRHAVPYALGDTYRGHRVIGTSPALFEVLRGRDGRVLGAGMQGRAFVPGLFEAVVGAAVARSTGLRLGSTIRVTHGLVEGARHHEHEETWEVRGVLRPTGTASDRAIYIPIDTFFAVEGHGPPSGEGTENEEEDHEEGGRALSAVGLRFHVPTFALSYLDEYRRGRGDAQAVLPVDQVRRITDLVGSAQWGIRLVAALVVVVAGMGILVGLYNTIQGRRREIAVLRSLGAGRGHVFGVILLEAVLLCLLGGVAGLFLGRVALAVAGPLLYESYGVLVRPGLGREALALAGAVALGVLAGLLPAWRGLITPVAANLHPQE